VQSNHVVDAIQRTIVHHHRRATLVLATGGFFGWLKDKAHVAFELAGGEFLLEQVGHTQQNRGV
jgi:hypothetical protein